MIVSGLPNFIRIVCWIFWNFTFKTSLDNSFNFQNSIRAHVGHTAFATLQIELYRVVDYDSKWSTKFYKDCKFEFFVISLLRRLMIMFLKFSKLYYGQCQAQSFCNTKIKLYRVVDYGSKWSTKFHEDCTLEFFVISL